MSVFLADERIHWDRCGKGVVRRRIAEGSVKRRIVYVFEDETAWRVVEEGDQAGSRFRTREAALVGAARLARENDSGIVLGPPPQDEGISIPRLGPLARA